MEFYDYHPIDLEGRSMRLVQLCGAEDGPIRCRLFDASLDDDGLMDYEALSYTWGSPHRSQLIEMDGKVMRVTLNLIQALRALRYRKDDRIFWIDAVCIDQDNLKERGHQVRQMGSIYEKAVKVVVWLGSATLETDRILEDLKMMEKESIKHACANWNPADPRWAKLWQSVRTPLLIGQTTPMLQQRQGLTELLNRPWFRRIWIIQEVIKSRSVQVVCGRSSVSGRTFALAPMLVGVVPSSHCQAILDVFPGPVRRYSWWAESQDLHTLLLKFRSSEASEPRDRIYALLGIASDRNTFEVLQPDYDCSEQELVKRTVSDILHIPAGLLNENHCPSSIEDLYRSLDSITDEVLLIASRNGQDHVIRKMLILLDFEEVISRRISSTPDSFALNTNLSGMFTLYDRGVVNDGTRDLASWILHWIIVLSYGIFLTEELHPYTVNTQKFIPESTTNLQNETVLADLVTIGKKLQIFEGTTICDGEHGLASLLLNRFGIMEPNYNKPIDTFSLFWWAAVNKHMFILSMLLAKQPYADAAYVYGQNLLHRLARNGHKEMFHALLHHWKPQIMGFRHTIRNMMSWLPENNLETVSELMTEESWSINEASDGLDRWAEVFQREEVLRLLAENGESINDILYDGHTPLSRAACRGDINLVCLLLQSQIIRVNQRSATLMTPLEHAITNIHADVADILLHTPGILISKEEGTMTASSSTAIVDRHNAIVQMFLSSDQKSTFEMKIIAEAIGDSALRMLLHERVRQEFSWYKDLSQSWLLYAAKHGHVDIMKALLRTREPHVSAGYDLHEQQALWEATYHGQYDIVALVVAIGRVDIYLVHPKLGQNAIGVALSRGHGEIAGFLDSSTKHTHKTAAHGMVPL